MLVAANEVSLPAPSTLAAVGAASQGEGDILTPLPRPETDYPIVDLGFPTIIPIFQGPLTFISAAFRVLTMISQGRGHIVNVKASMWPPFGRGE